MFRNANRGSRETLLPHSGNGRGGGGGLYGKARMSPKASLSKSFIATMIWAMVSVSLIGGGWIYCSRNMEATSVKCDLRKCDVTELKSGVTTTLTIPHSRMVRAELVRLKNGQVVDPATLGRPAQRKLGHSYSVVYMEADSEEDDDDSYDSFEDDDDSYDSYDDDDPSSDEDDDDTLPSSRKPAAPAPKEPLAAPRRDHADAAAAAERAARSRKAALEKKEAQRRMWAEERENKGLPPIKEPDEQAAARGRAGGRPRRDDDEERFPGDAGTLREKNIAEIRRMEATQGMAADEHRERSQRAYEEAAKKHQAKAQMDAQMKQRGNNLHDRAAQQAKPAPRAKRDLSTDDPDSNSIKPPANGGGDRGRPKLERQKFEPAIIVDELERGVEDAEAKKGGGRKLLSSVGGLEEMGEDRGEHERLLAEVEDEQDQGKGKGSKREREREREEGDQTLGEFVQAGAAGARKLLSLKDRVKNIKKPAPAKRTKEELAKDAAKARDAHRKGHGHHQKKARKFADPRSTDEEEQKLAAQLNSRRKPHHHKAFHHKEEVPQAARHHVHHRFHHQPGQEKLPHGWRHQNRQWHGHSEQKKLGTTFSLGRALARKRKETIDSYVSRRTDSVDFTDSKKWRAGGLWLIILGCISTAFCIVIGNFQPRPKIKKVS